MVRINLLISLAVVCAHCFCHAVAILNDDNDGGVSRTRHHYEKQRASSDDDNHIVLQAGNHVHIRLEKNSGAATILVDNDPWFHLVGGMEVVGWDNNNNESLQLVSTNVTSNLTNAVFGTFTMVTYVWTTSNKRSSSHYGDYKDEETDDQLVETSFFVFDEHEIIIFDQNFETGWARPDDVEPKDLPPVLAGFPSINLTLPHSNLDYLVWGNCFLTDSWSGLWADVKHEDYPNFFNGDTHGQPWMLHDDQGRSVVWSNLDNFFVSGFAACPAHDTLHVGLRTTLESIPAGHHHTSLFVAGHGINATLMEWGDVLLKNGPVQKERSHVYDDFTLAHLGYWTDNGAYHYEGAYEEEKYANMEEALLGIRDGMKDANIPIHYMQWDDWWMESKGDIPGILSWTPKSDVFPSGFSDWLGMPLALYAPEYSSENVWMHDYAWKTSGGATAIPLDPDFYMDLFRNGTQQVQMQMFEQDFLCSNELHHLTNTDVYSGQAWFVYMDAAAIQFDIKLQYCMPNAYHLLQSTTIQSVTNARATGDNTRNWNSIWPMGQNALLFHALGVFTSRDNVWTSAAAVQQTGCGNDDFCYEPNAHLDNAVAVLSGGPYGIADGLGYTNRTLVMYACRTDGFLLRPRWPLATMDFVYTAADAKGTRVWAAHDDFGPYRWSYVVGIHLDEEVAISPRRLLQRRGCSCGEMVAWEVVVGEPVVASVVPFSNDAPFMLPKSKPLNLPYNVTTPSHTHFATAPVLPNGMVFLGETSKWASMSFGRVTSFEAREDGDVTANVVGAPSENVTFAYLKEVDATAASNEIISQVSCEFSNTCSETDQHGNNMCRAKILCQPSTGCTCSGQLEEEEQSRLRGTTSTN